MKTENKKLKETNFEQKWLKNQKKLHQKIIVLHVYAKMVKFQWNMINFTTEICRKTLFCQIQNWSWRPWRLSCPSPLAICIATPFYPTGLRSGATPEEINRAYRKLSLLLHPDKSVAPGSEEAFKQLGLARTALLQKNCRKNRFSEDRCRDS